MKAHMKEWADNLREKHKAAIQPSPPVSAPETPMTPLVQRLKKLLDSLPADLRAQPQSLEFFRQGLRGRQSGNNAHAGELGAALRKLGYVRRRSWSTSENGFRSLWHPPC